MYLIMYICLRKISTEIEINSLMSEKMYTFSYGEIHG